MQLRLEGITTEYTWRKDRALERTRGRRLAIQGLLVIVILGLLSLLASSTAADPASLAPPVAGTLANPGFEGTFSERESGVIVAEGWEPWYISDHPDHPYHPYLRRPEWKPANPYYSDPPVFPNRVRSGLNAQQYFTFYGTHIAGLHQVVPVTPGERYRLSVWGHSWSADDDDDDQSGDEYGNLRMKVGIDPTGGTDHAAPGVVWCEERFQYDTWGEFNVEAVALGEEITVFLYSSPEWAVKHNDVYWDDASLDCVTPLVELSAGNDSPTALGSTTHLTATVAEGGQVSYAWAYGDGESGHGSAVAHEYPSIGSYTAVVTASNCANVLTATTRVTIIEPPTPTPVPTLPFAPACFLPLIQKRGSLR